MQTLPPSRLLKVAGTHLINLLEMPEIREREVAIVYWSFKTLSCYCEEVWDKCNGPKSPTLPSDGNFTGKIGISTIASICQRATRFFGL